MTVILINPNSTDAMTQSALIAAQNAAPDIQFEGWTSGAGPAAIEGAQDGARAVPPLLELVSKASASGAEVIIIACFDDTGLAAAQRIANCPVIGIGQASFLLASLLAKPAAVITTVDAAVPVIATNIQNQGHCGVIGTVLAAGAPVLSLEREPQAAAQKFKAAAQALPPEICTLILGCAGAVTIKSDIQHDLDLTILDGVTAAARLCRAFTT